MEMLIQIIDQLQIQTANPSLNTKPVNAKPAAPGQKCFKATLNEALGTASSTGEQRAAVQSETETTDPAKSANTTEEVTTVVPLVVPPVVVTELLQGVVQETAQTSQSAVPEGPTNTAEQPASVAMVTQNTPQGAAFTHVQNSSTASGGQKTLTTEQNILLAADEQGQIPVTPQTETTSMVTSMVNKQTANQTTSYIANNPTSSGLSTEAVSKANTIHGTVANPSQTEQSVQEPQTISDRTVMVIPVAVAQEQLSDSTDSNTADTSVMTPLTAAQPVKQDVQAIPFPAGETAPPVKEQVVQAIVQRARLISDGTQQQMQIQLKPEHLGTLNVQIAVENGAVTAKFLTDNPQVKQALEASFNQLKQDLQAQGFKVQDVAVSVAQQGMSFSEFSRRSPQFELIKSKRLGKVSNEVMEQTATVNASLLENYGGLFAGEVDYKV